MAPYLLVPATRFLIPLGSLDPRAAAPLSDAALTSYHAVKRSLHLLGPGSTAVVIGAGGLGQMAIQILRALSSSTTVVAVDTAADKLATAERMGAQLAELIAARYPDRTVHVVGDAAYVGERLRNLDSRISGTSRLKITSVLHELPPPRTGRSGQPRTRSARLGTPTDLAASATVGARWRDARVRRYGRTDSVQITEITCLWYGSFRSHTVRVVLVRDNKPRTRDRDDRGYGLPLVTTDLESSAEDLVARYAARWGIERTSPTPARSSAWAMPATGPVAPWNGPCRSG